MYDTEGVCFGCSGVDDVEVMTGAFLSTGVQVVGLCSGLAVSSDCQASCVHAGCVHQAVFLLCSSQAWFVARLVFILLHK